MKGDKMTVKNLVWNKWLDTFVEEKDIDTGFTFEFEDKNGFHIVEVADVIAFIKKLGWDHKTKIKDTFVKIDFMNGDPMHFMSYMAKGMAKATYTEEGAA